MSCNNRNVRKVARDRIINNALQMTRILGKIGALLALQKGSVVISITIDAYHGKFLYS